MKGGRGWAGLILSAALIALLSGCGNDTQSTLAPASHQAADIASLFWWMTGGAFIGLALVVVLLLWSWTRRNRKGFGRDTEGPKPGERQSMRVVVVMGIVVPIVVLCVIFVISDIFVIQTTQAPAATKTKLTVVVTGHQWWWEASYPGTRAVTANEIHIPARTPVLVQVEAADVIHSFWVPRLNRKIDMIPGRTNEVELYADHVGVYRGQCAEFCGLQHAHMSFLVVAQPTAAFHAWLAHEAQPASAPQSGAAQAGEHVFLNGPCQSCHAIRGTAAVSTVGPDLTHVGGRTTLAAVTIANTPAELADWLVHPQQIKPGNEMPDLNLTGAQVRELVAYLEGLR